MKVSVIIPSYNHQDFIEQAILSVISQGYKDLELIVIDDGSTDNSPEILKRLKEKYDFHLTLKKNEGVCKTLNTGIKIAKGEFITFLASDDLMTKGRIEEQVSFMNKNLNVDIAAGEVVMIDVNGMERNRRKIRKQGFLEYNDMIKRNLVFAPTAFFRANVFQKYGYYNEEIVLEDFYMWLNVLSQGGTIYNTKNIWAKYRLTSENLEKRFHWYYKGYEQVISHFLSNSKAHKFIDKYYTILSLKLAFLLGLKFLKTNEFKKNSFSRKLMLFTIASLPPSIRRGILHQLLLKY